MTDLNSDPELETQTRQFEKKPAPISPVWEEINAIKVPRSPEHVSSHVTVGKKKLFVLIVAGFRTGSTLLGQFFNQNDKIFYIFEPLHQVSMLPLLHSQQFPIIISTNQLREIAAPRFDSINRSDHILSEGISNPGTILRELCVHD